jgi:hypothetical protein
MALFGIITKLASKVIPKGTFVGDLLGSTKPKGTNILGQPKRDIPEISKPSIATKLRNLNQAIKVDPVISPQATAEPEKTNPLIYVGIGLGVLGLLYAIFKN